MTQPALNETEQLLLEVDREAGYRRLVGKWLYIIGFLAVALSLFHLYTSIFGVLPPTLQRAPHLAIALGLIFLLYPAKRGRIDGRVPWYDILQSATALAVCFYHIWQYESLIERAGDWTNMDLAVSLLGLFLVLEATRRVSGWAIVAMALIFLAYGSIGGFLPGVFGHRGFSWERIVTHTFLTTEGIFGVPLGVSATFIYIYLIFAAVMEKTGIRQLFIDLALALTGRSIGGPAKAAVISSALEGTVSGSSIANVAGSGSFTIPMMKKLGYRAEFAAAVEAAASTGGQIMPPVMGAAAFLIADFINVPYTTIALAASIPALLYFAGVFIMVHFEAKRVGMKPAAAEDLPSLKKTLIERGYLFLPLIGIIFLLNDGATPIKAAVYGIGIALLVGALKKETRVGPLAFLKILEETGRSALGVIAACAAAGIVVGMVSLTGLGIKGAGALVDLAGGNLLLAMALTMVASLILGMGVPTTATYVILATMAAPALVNLGVPILAAHLFVFYFGIVADITPPVALAAYAGAAIARCSPMKAGWEATRLALGAFLAPYMFCLNPVLLMQTGTAGEIAMAATTATTGMISLGAGAIGYLVDRCSVPERFLLVAGGLLLIDPGMVTDLIGAGILVAVFLLQKRRAALASQGAVSVG